MEPCFMAITWLLAPTAIILCIVLFRRIEKLTDAVNRLNHRIDQLQSQRSTESPVLPAESPAPEPAMRSAPVPQTTPPLAAASAAPKEPPPPQEFQAQPAPVPAPQTPAIVKPETQPAAGRLEERIGTRWVLIAGVIAVIFAAGFFLKYAYDNFSIGALGKVIAVTVSGLVALAAGEITRRRGYDIVAKGVTAMGFALLYAAVFAAYRVFGLINAPPAFAIAIAVTACAMAYAVVLDEVIIAFLSLLGGYLTPLLLSTGDNRPGPLFTYVLILSLGAMLCAYARRWRTINILAWLGTYALYAGWYEKFFRPALDAAPGLPKQTPIALAWLAVFFALYLLIPILNGLIHRTKAGKGDVLCVLGNALIVFFYLWTTLHDDARTALAWCAVAMAAAHLAAMALVRIRCKDDTDLRAVLLTLALALLTVTMPLYWRFNALTLAWSLQALVLLLVGLRYRSLLTQAFGFIALIFACGNLLARLPLHTGVFDLVGNAPFGTWCFVAAVACIAHLLYRFAARAHTREAVAHATTAQILYILAGLVLLTAASMEWHAHCRLNLPGLSWPNILKGQLLILTAMTLLFTVRPICPAGILRQTAAILLVAAGTLCTLTLLPILHTHSFLLVANRSFAIVSAFIAAVALCHILHRRRAFDPTDADGIASQLFYALAAALAFLTLSAEWYFHCAHNVTGADHPIFTEPLFLRGLTILAGLFLLAFAARPLSPPGDLTRTFAILAAAAGAAFVMSFFNLMHNAAFTIFANPDFAAALAFIAALGLAAWLLRDWRPSGAGVGGWTALGAVVVLWAVISIEVWLFWYCRHTYGPGSPDWKFLAHTWLSVTWALYGAALMIAGFALKERRLRYMALALFAVLLVKVFYYDTRRLEQVYRIAAFFATGITLVGVSYLYQFLKKKGFFSPRALEAPTPAKQIEQQPDHETKV